MIFCVHHVHITEWMIFCVHIWYIFTLRNDDFCVILDGMNEWLLCAYKRHVHITEWMIFCVHIRDMFTLRNEWSFCVHIRDMFTLRNEWFLCACILQNEWHETFTLPNEWFFVCKKEKCSHYGMNDLLCAYKRHVHITEWMIFCVHIRDMFTLRNEWY